MHENTLLKLKDIILYNCHPDNEKSITWDIDLPSSLGNIHSLGHFSYNDGSFPIQVNRLDNFIIQYYRKPYKYFGTFFIIATADDESVHISGSPVRDFNYTRDKKSGLYISQDDCSDDYLLDFSDPYNQLSDT